MYNHIIRLSVLLYQPLTGLNFFQLCEGQTVGEGTRLGTGARRGAGRTAARLYLLGGTDVQVTKACSLKRQQQPLRKTWSWYSDH